MSVIGPNIVEPDINNWDSIPLGQGVAAGPVEHNGSVYVAGQRIDHAGTSNKLAVFRSNDSFTLDKHVLDFSNGPDCQFASRSGVTYSSSDHRFYFSNVDPSGNLSIASFDIFTEQWVLNDTGGPSGPDIGRDGTSIVRTSSGAFLLLYTNITGTFPSLLNSLNIVQWLSGTWGTHHVFISSIPDSFQLIAAATIDSSDKVWTSYVRFVGTTPFPILYDSISVTSAGIAGTPIQMLDVTNKIDIGAGPSEYVSSLDTVVMPLGITYTNLGPTGAEFHLFEISPATGSPSFTDVLVTSTGFGGDPASNFPGAFLSNAAENNFAAFVIGLANVGTDEQLWRFMNSSITTWPNPLTVDWDYDTNPPQSGPSGIPGIEPDSCLAPAYLDSETAYGTLLTFFYPICPEIYYMKVGLPAPATGLSWAGVRRSAHGIAPKSKASIGI